MTLRNFILPGMAAFVAMFGGMPATAQERSSLQEQTAELRAMRKVSEACNKGKQCLVSQGDVRLELQPQAPPGPPAPKPAPPAPEPALATASTATLRLGGGEITLADIGQEPPNSLPQQQAGEKWSPARIHTEVRNRPRDTAFDVKAELLTKNGWMFGIQHVNSSGYSSGSNATDVFRGDYTDTRSELWVGRHGVSKDSLKRWSLVGFGRQVTHTDSGSGQSRPGTEYPYSYNWKNSPKPITQLGVRVRIERDLIQSASQQLTIHGEVEVATTVAGGSGLAFNAKTGVWYRTAQVEAYGEVGVNNTGAYANGYGRYYLTKDGQLRLFGEVRGEVGDGYHNVQVGGGLQLGLGRNGYAEAVLGYNIGTSGDGLAATGRIGFKF